MANFNDFSHPVARPLKSSRKLFQVFYALAISIELCMEFDKFRLDEVVSVGGDACL